MSNNIAISQSFTGAAYSKVEPYITTNDDDKGVKRVAKISAGLVANPVFALAMAVETVVRGLLTMLAKLAHFLMPKDKEITRTFEKNVFTPLSSSTLLNGALTVFTGARTGLNFVNDEKQKSACTAINNQCESIANSKAINFLTNVHINGVYKETA